MTTELHKVPGYTRNIVLVGWPADKVPDLYPHTPTMIDVGIHSILAHDDDLLAADLVVFYPRNDILRPPATDAEFAMLGAVGRITKLGKHIPAQQPDVDDLTIGKKLVTEEWDRVFEIGCRLLMGLVTLPSEEQVFGATVIVFLPEDMDESDQSAWAGWLDLPVRDSPGVHLPYAAMDSHCVSWLYSLAVQRWLDERSFTSSDSPVRRPFEPDELAHGILQATAERQARWDSLRHALPPHLLKVPLLHDEGGLTAALAVDLPDGAEVRIHGKQPAADGQPSATAEIFPVLIIMDAPCTSVRVRVGKRNMFLLPTIPNIGQLVTDAAKFLYRYGKESVRNEADFSMPDAGAWARAQLEPRMRKPNPIVGESAAILPAYLSLLDAVEHSRDPILVCGPIGCGKEVFLDAMRALLRGDQECMTVDLVGLEANSLVSQLFGHEKGAYTTGTYRRKGAVEQVRDGTLVLDNFQNVSPEIQAKILRLLESKGEYQRMGSDEIRTSQARIVVATNVEPEDLIERGKMLPDLLSRFPIVIHIPPLNARRVDIPLLVNAFFEEYLKASHWGAELRPLLSIGPMLDTWMRANWDGAAGNVRGLRNEVVRALRELRQTAMRIGMWEPSGTEADSAPSSQTPSPTHRPGRQRGRKKGRNIADDALQKIISEAGAHPDSCNIHWVFTKIDECLPRARKMRRTKRALVGRIRRMDDADAMQRCLDAVRRIPGFGDLPPCKKPARRS